MAIAETEKERVPDSDHLVEIVPFSAPFHIYCVVPPDLAGNKDGKTSSAKDRATSN